MKLPSGMWTQNNRRSRWAGYLVITVVILLLLFVLFRIFVKLRPRNDADTSRGIARIQEMEAENADKIQDRIVEMRRQWVQQKTEEAVAENGENTEDEDSEDYDENYDESYDEDYDESYDEDYDESYDESYDEDYDESYDESE